MISQRLEVAFQKLRTKTELLWGKVKIFGLQPVRRLFWLEDRPFLGKMESGSFNHLCEKQRSQKCYVTNLGVSRLSQCQPHY
jgi:hypothetical protein